MDFVPAQRGSKGLQAPSRKRVTKRVVDNSQGIERGVGTVQQRSAKKRVQSTSLVQDAEVLRMSERRVIKLNEREDFNRKFVNRDVPKRPLSSPGGTVGYDELERARRLAIRERQLREARAAKEAEGQKKSVRQSERKEQRGQERKSPFINQGAVEKRPLSGRVAMAGRKPLKEGNYRGAEVGKQRKSKQKEGPETIILKPEKQNHAGMIVAVILTIILGAAAGTVAFLLLPK